MTTIIETFTSVPILVTLQHVLDAVQVFGPLAAIAIITHHLTK